MFENALWQSKCNAKTNPAVVLFWLTLVFLLAIFFIIHFFGFGIFFGIDLALIVGCLVVGCIIARKLRWYNNKLWFAIMDSGIYFTQIKAQTPSYFQEDISNITGYSYVADGNYHTVTVYFNMPAYAGVFGKIRFIKMVRIEDFDKLQKALQSYSIPVVQNAEKN